MITCSYRLFFVIRPMCFVIQIFKSILKVTHFLPNWQNIFWKLLTENYAWAYNKVNNVHKSVGDGSVYISPFGTFSPTLQYTTCTLKNIQKSHQGIRIINLVYFSQIINLLPHADSADLRRTRIVNSRVPSGWQRGRSDSQILRKSAESAWESNICEKMDCKIQSFVEEY